MKKIETKKDEVRIRTISPQEMLWKFTAENVLKTWVEDFVDHDTAEVVSITRSEILFKKGIYIDQDKLQEIQFFQQTGDISEVEVSNQQRAGFETNSGGIAPWSVSFRLSKSKGRLLLYAHSIQMAIDVAKDFLELNYKEAFVITNAKDFTDCVMIQDEELEETEEPQTDDDGNMIEKKFYQIEVNVKTENGTYTQVFIIRDTDVNSALVRIEVWIKEQIKERAKKREIAEVELFDITIERAIAISCTRTIEKEFSMAYLK